MNNLADRDYFSDYEVLNRPYDYFDAVRERGPVYVVPESGVVVVVGFKEALQVLGNDDCFSAAITAQGAGAPLPFTPSGEDLTPQIEAHRTDFRAGEELIALDDKRHDFSRSLVSGFFVPSRLAANEAFMNRASERFVKTALNNNGMVEMMHEITVPYTTIVIANLLDVPESDHEAICEIFRNNEINNLDADNFDLLDVSSLTDTAKFFWPYIQARAEAPGDDITSALAVAKYPDGSTPEMEERVRLATLLFAAGQDTTAKLIGNAMRYLVEYPDLQHQLRSDPSLMPAFIEEMLRIEGSTKVTARLARKRTEIGGVPISPGTRVLVPLAGANRDPARWPDPGEFELGRPRIKEHVAFSRGAHACVGAQLARTESRILIENFLRLTSRIDYDETFHGPAGARKVEYEPNFILRGISELHLKLTPP